MLHVLAVTNMYPTVSAPTAGTFVERQVNGLRQIGIKVEVVCMQRTENGRAGYLSLQRQVRHRVAIFNPDIVHVMYGGVMAWQVVQVVRNRPVIVSFCGTDLLGQPLVGFFRKLSSRFNVWASYAAARRATAIVVKSRNLFDALPTDVDRSKVRIIPNGVDIERFKPMAKFDARKILGWPLDSKVVLFVTVRGHPRKRLDLAQQAVTKVRNSSPNVTLKVMQGVPHEQVPVWMNASDVLVLASVHEGSVNTVKEAMACNLPIVSVDVGDVRERLEAVQRCTIVEPTADALGEALGESLGRDSRSDGRDHLADLTIGAIAWRLQEFYLQTLRLYSQDQPFSSHG